MGTDDKNIDTTTDSENDIVILKFNRSMTQTGLVVTLIILVIICILIYKYIVCN